MTLGEKILKLRKEKGWSQDKLGDKIGVYGRRVSLYENDKSTPSAETLQKLADIFEVSLDYLLSDSPKNITGIPIKDPSLIPYFEELDQLDEDDKKTIKSMIEALAMRKKVKEMAGEKK
jgi:transcriptional regulator with XRE-family HTH domain